MSEKQPIKRIPKDDVKPRPQNPLYPAFTYQMSAALELARKMEADKTYPVPGYVQRFLDEFGSKSVVK
jgi:hypothetical protein